MVTTSKAYQGMRAFVDALESLEANGFHRVTSRRPRQSALRLSLRRSTFATSSAAQQSSTSSKSAISSTGIDDHIATRIRHELPNKTPSLDSNRHQHANAVHQSESRPDNPITEARKGPIPGTVHAKILWGRMSGSAKRSSASYLGGSANPNQLPKQDFVDDWFFGMVKEQGWLLRKSSTRPDKASMCRFSYRLSRPDTAESWKVSVQEKSEEQARTKAIPRLFAKVYGTCGWNEPTGTELSASETYLRCLKMVLDDRLVLKISRKRDQNQTSFWFVGWIHVPEMEKHVRFNRCIPEDRETSTAPLSSVIMEVVSILRKEGIWQDLLKTPSQPKSPSSPNELASEPGDLIASGLTKSAMTDPSEPLTQRSIMALLRAFFRARGKWPERFHHEMASVSIDTIVRVDTHGTTTCHALYNQPFVEPIKGEVVIDPSKSVLRSQIESMAIGLILPKLENSGIWDKFLEVNYAPSLFLGDDLVWQINKTNSQLSKNEDYLKRTFLKDEEIQRMSSSHGQHRNVERLRQIQERSEQLTCFLKEFEQSRDPEVVAIRSARAELPVSQKRDELLQMINQNTYSVVSAETGSGKSTQIPQIILDDAIRKGKGGECRVLCVQPRRLAAELLGDRVAAERNEVIGETVGYEVRFRRKSPIRDGNIMYCTTGILLNMLANDREKLQSLTHIMLDEVHVRETDIDFAMLLLKRHVDQCRSTGTREPRIVIMSATVNQDLFSSYFMNIGPDGKLIPAPSLSISGRQYHVEQHYLDDILDAVSTSFKEKPYLLYKVLDGEGESSTFLNKQYRDFGDEFDDEFGDIEEPGSATSTSLMETHVTPTTLEECNVVPIGLITALVFHLLLTTNSGSILIFLPGIDSIKKLQNHLLYCTDGLRDGTFNFDLAYYTDRFRILRLHSDLQEELEKLAEPFQEGCRRIFLSTDIAEASVTLPDVSYVIDSGKLNLASYDSARQSHRLRCTWAAKSNAIQRAGRAGRVKNGHYYFLGTKRRYDSLQPAVAPEIRRADLHAVCLRAKTIDRDVPVVEVLQQAIEPPSPDAVSNTVKSLKRLKAFDENERLTSLGALMSRIGVVPPASKLIILGLIFRCLDPLLVLAVQVEKGSLFQPFTADTFIPILESKKQFVAESHSDHITEINAFNALRTKSNEFSASDFADSNYLQLRVFWDIHQIASLVLQSLSANNMITKAQAEIFDPFGGPDFNVNSNNAPLLNALIAHCFSGQIAFPDPIGSLAYITPMAGKMTLRSSSLARSTSPYQPQQIIASSFKRDPQIYTGAYMAIEASAINPLSLCLLGESLTWDGELLRVDSWLPIRLEAEDVHAKEQAAQSLIKLNQQLHKHLETAYDFLYSRRWGRPMHESHRRYSHARWVSRHLLSESITNVQSLSKSNSTISEPLPKWNLWEQLKLDLEEASMDQDEGFRASRGQEGIASG